jgi:hypothetical protein
VFNGINQVCDRPYCAILIVCEVPCLGERRSGSRFSFCMRFGARIEKLGE